MFLITFIGRVTKDATAKQFEKSNVLNFTVAVNFPTQGKDENGNTIYDTIYLPCSKWNLQGDLNKVCERLKKGARIAVQGSKLEVTTHQDQNTGKEYTNLNVVVQSFEVLDYPQQPQAVTQGYVQQQGQPLPQATPQQAFYPQQGQPQQGQPQQGQGFFAKMNEEQRTMQAQAFEQVPPEVRHTYQQAPQGLEDVDLSY
ncbi:single-stranded DNA-binding protein [Capnocytophaga sputigena]|uniref:single-stranded DNA-binding protein n=1 Tax=Capnocytophaga sputigena TaxID=1019 RepID=UPI003C76FDA7